MIYAVRELDVDNAVLDREVSAADETCRPFSMAPDASAARRRRQIKIDALGPRRVHQLLQAEGPDVVTHQAHEGPDKSRSVIAWLIDAASHAVRDFVQQDGRLDAVPWDRDA